jgi:uncharacterized protein YbcI
MSQSHAENALGAQSAAISNAVVRLFSEYTGRGPTKARSNIEEQMVTVLMHDTLTKGERSLAAAGSEQQVLDMRRAFQRTMRPDLIAVVEEIIGRPVTAFMSDNHIDPDMAVEVFVLDGVGHQRAAAPSGAGQEGGDAG